MIGNLCKFIGEEPPVNKDVKYGGMHQSTRMGEIVEHYIALNFLDDGHGVSKPMTQVPDCYDLVVDIRCSGELVGVQVKKSKTKDEIVIASGRFSKNAYDPQMVQWFAIKLEGSNRYFIIPIEATNGAKKLRLGNTVLLKILLYSCFNPRSVSVAKSVIIIINMIVLI